MQLESIDQALLDGAFGAASAHAMRLLVRYGEVFEADRFISIESAHIDGCLYHGPSSINFVRRFVDLGGRVRVPTTLNVAAVDVVHPGWHQGPPDLLSEQALLTALHEELGCVATLTCAPYQRMLRPGLGDHIAWAESNAIAFANSVLGARTDRYGDFTDLCAALTGRVPYVGLHRPENRRATLVVQAPAIDATGLARDLYFAAMGYVLGARSAGHVPAIVGLPPDASEDELKALGASAASAGAIALFHAVGITPEAATLSQATGGADAEAATIAISGEELRAAVRSLCPLLAGERIAAVCLGTPHFSIAEFEHLARIVDGRRASVDVEVYVSTSREIAAHVERTPELGPVLSFGAKLVVDTCTYLAPVVRETTGAIVTNSGKWAHYGPGNLGRRVGLMTLEQCVRSAETGRVAAS
ncbi:aconitase X [Rhizorhabdus histidinilytica]|uniref:Predicted aconitase subunit 1 n=1 Tax=Rhizorhabdus histidinilytica TaxID=439228 RepID=A0A1T5B8U2_9SPHN|nr:aconitase X catalytic domain-containing protein [Rhizorhabdus histidinilytica]SKB43400.1 predicted aconitase subunit 1 [Rhizorhabdus histidinilytica]